MDTERSGVALDDVLHEHLRSETIWKENAHQKKWRNTHFLSSRATQNMANSEEAEWVGGWRIKSKLWFAQQSE